MYGTVQVFKKTSNRTNEKKTNFNIYAPERLKNKIDEIVEKSDEYENRSQYIRKLLNKEIKRCDA